MTDDDRRSFPNLILLCKPHHDLVDKIRPDDSPVETLEQWKLQREEGESAALRSITEDRLEELIIEAIRHAGPTRLVTVEFGGGALLGAEAVGVPIELWQTLLDSNPHLCAFDKVLVTTVRKVGALRAAVESVDVFLGVEMGGTAAPLTMLGRRLSGP